MGGHERAPCSVLCWTWKQTSQDAVIRSVVAHGENLRRARCPGSLCSHELTEVLCLKEMPGTFIFTALQAMSVGGLLGKINQFPDGSKYLPVKKGPWEFADGKPQPGLFLLPLHQEYHAATTLVCAWHLWRENEIIDSTSKLL